MIVIIIIYICNIIELAEAIPFIDKYPLISTTLYAYIEKKGYYDEVRNDAISNLTNKEWNISFCLGGWHRINWNRIIYLGKGCIFYLWGFYRYM